MQTQKPLRMPGATLMTRLRVYDTATPDGQIGGTPHVHLVCTEMYVVLSGSGAVEMIDKDGFSRIELGQHDALLFTPGSIHRLINPNGDLDILVIMQNSGLPERGDNVVTFTDEWLATDSAYTEAMTVTSLEEAHQRRDRAVTGFMQLKTAFENSNEAGQVALAHFYRHATARTAHWHTQWREIVQQGALATVKESLAQIDQLEQHDTDYLSHNAYTRITMPEQATLGFCGHLNRYFDPATLLLEGQRIP